MQLFIYKIIHTILQKTYKSSQKVTKEVLKVQTYR